MRMSVIVAWRSDASTFESTDMWDILKLSIAWRRKKRNIAWRNI